MSIALVGQSGSGKTSIGTCFLDFGSNWGQDNNRWNWYQRLHTWKSPIADVSRITGCIPLWRYYKNNITYGVKSSVTEEIDAAIDAADLRGLVKSLLRASTHPSEKEESCFQDKAKEYRWRAILKNAPIIILDEATSALDSKSENEIKNALKNLTKGKISITVAHRLSTIEDCNRICNIRWRNKEEGNHQSFNRKWDLCQTL